MENLPRYFEDCTTVRVNTLAPRCYYIDRNNSVLLNGDDWDFQLFSSFIEAEYYILTKKDYKWTCTIQVPGHWQLQGYGAPRYTNILYPFSLNPPYVPSENPTGVYRKKFNFPSNWEIDDSSILLRFDGVDSAYYVILNGQFIGYCQGSRNPAEFDISKVVKKTDNSLVVIVLQYSDGSYLEDQDGWWLSGIFRNVFLLRFSSQCRIIDYQVSTVAIADSYATMKFDFTIYSSKENTFHLILKVCKGKRELTTKVFPVEVSGQHTYSFDIDIIQPLLWTAELPNLYDFEVTLFDEAHTSIQSIGTHFGIRTTVIKDGLLQINGVPILLRGMNRHDHNPKHGRAVTAKDVLHDLMLMKKYNINAIRCSHYPSHPSVYYWADILGFYILDEADLECHGFQSTYWVDQAIHNNTPSPVDATLCTPCLTKPQFYSEAKSYISDNPLWKIAYLDRVEQMVMRDRNHPSVIIWSLGNESFFGSNHVEMYKWIKEKFSDWPVHYERDRDATVVDIESIMYPSYEYVKQRGEIEQFSKPFILCEYGHSMGNGPGGLSEYQELFYKFPRLQGGFIWEWADHGLEVKDTKGNFKFYGYGGDFGEDIHDHTYVMDGMCFSNHTPTPGLLEYKYVIQPVKFDFYVSNDEAITVQITNLYDFITLEKFKLCIQIDYYDKEIFSKVSHQDMVVYEQLGEVRPHQSKKFQIRQQQNYRKQSSKILITACIISKEHTVWLDRSHEVAFDQYWLKPSLTESKFISEPSLKPLQLTNTPLDYTIKNNSSEIIFSRISGYITHINIDGVERILSPIKPGFWRAPTDNDRGHPDMKRVFGIDSDYTIWKTYHVNHLRESLESIVAKVENDGSIAVTTKGWLGAAVMPWGLVFELSYHIMAAQSGFKINVKLKIDPKGYFPPNIPRIGLDFVLPRHHIQSVDWLGRGPGESYSDSKSGLKMGVFSSNVSDLFTNYSVPQENGNRSDIMWLKAKGKNDSRSCFGAYTLNPNALLNFNVSLWNSEQLSIADHPCELPNPGKEIYFRIDFKVHGLGSATAGPRTQKKYSCNLESFQGSFCLYIT